jgi:hypothetical protein
MACCCCDAGRLQERCSAPAAVWCLQVQHVLRQQQLLRLQAVQLLVCVGTQGALKPVPPCYPLRLLLPLTTVLLLCQLLPG